MRVTYTGPSVAVDLLGPEDKTIRVGRGEVIEVPDDFGQELIRQASWEAVGDHTPRNPLLDLIPELNPNAARILVDHDYTDLETLAGASDDDLAGITGIGPSTIAAIRAVVPANGDE